MVIVNSNIVPANGQQGGIPDKSNLGRLLFNKTLDDNTSIDSKNNQTRPNQPDRCIVGDGVETLTFNAAVNGIKWYDEDRNLSAAIDISGTHIWIVPVDNISQVLMFSDALCTTQIGLLTLQEGTGLTCYDVGITTANNNYDATLSSDIRDTTIFEPTWQNWNDKYGYNLPAAVYIPADSNDLTKDVLGNALVYSGSVKYNADVVGMPIAESAGSGTLTFSDLSGVTIISSEGTATPSINGNDVEINSGTIWDLLLSDGTIIIDPLFGYDVSGNDNHATPANLTASTGLNLYFITNGYQRYRHDSDAINNPDKLIPYKSDGTKISPAIANYTLYSDHPAKVVGNVYGNNEAGYIDFAPVRSEQLGENRILNPKFINWTAGVPDNWVTALPSGVTITDVGNACQLISDGTYGYIAQTRLTVGKTYHYLIRVIDVTLGSFRLQGSAVYVNFSTSGWKRGSFVADNTVLLIARNSACNVTFSDIAIQEQISLPTSETGFKPFSIFNKLGFAGNSFNYNEWFEEEITHLPDFNPANPYEWNASKFFNTFMCYGNTEARYSIYFAMSYADNVADLQKNFSNLGIYLTTKTAAQMLSIASSGGWRAEWEMFSKIHFNSQFVSVVDTLLIDPFLDVSDNISKTMDWSSLRDHPVQSTSTLRPLFNFNATARNMGFAGVDEYLAITSKSLDADFRVLIKKVSGVSYLMGSDANNYISHNSTSLDVKINGTLIDFIPLRTGITGVNCLIEIKRISGSITAQAIKSDGTVIDGGLPTVNNDTLTIDTIGGYNSANVAASEIENYAIEKATAGNLTEINDNTLKQFAKI